LPYIHFTEDQKLRATSVNLETFLQTRREQLLRSGRDKRLASNHGVTVRGNRWYDHYAGEGGGPISFVQRFLNLSYPEAVSLLLNGEQGEPDGTYPVANRYATRQRLHKPFALPPASPDMRRLYAYMLQKRFIDRDVLTAFVREKLIYESLELSRDQMKAYHNAIFVGYDEQGVPRHAHKRGLYSDGDAFKGNIEGSDPSHCFHYDGAGHNSYNGDSHNGAGHNSYNSVGGKASDNVGGKVNSIVSGNAASNTSNVTGSNADSKASGNVSSRIAGNSNIGGSGRLYVFEAPVDMLSFITLYPQDWREHSYAALCGVSEHALLKRLELHPNLREIVLCLDHDEAGIEATGRLESILRGKNDLRISRMLPEYKDWNEDLKAERGLEPQLAQDHPQLTVADDVCAQIGKLCAVLPQSARPEDKLPALAQNYRRETQRDPWGRRERWEQARSILEDMAALALFAAAREYWHIGRDASPEALAKDLRASFRPHENRSALSDRDREIAADLTAAQKLADADGLRSEAQKEKQAEAFIRLALVCAKAVIRHEADELKQTREQETRQHPVMGME
jgi:hypothetical protein